MGYLIFQCRKLETEVMRSGSANVKEADWKHPHVPAPISRPPRHVLGVLASVFGGFYEIFFPPRQMSSLLVRYVEYEIWFMNKISCWNRYARLYLLNLTGSVMLTRIF